MPTFAKVLRGYSAKEVDAWAAWAETHPDEVRTAEPPRFLVSLRGYDRPQVDEWVERLRNP